jgi:hypothetical protein
MLKNSKVKFLHKNQMLGGPVVIDAEFGREDQSSITATAFGRRLKSLTARTRHEL